MDDDYVCAISGKEAREDELVLDAPEDDELEALPVGWIKVTVERRGVNPAWLAVQGAKARLLAQMQATIPADAPDEVRMAMTLDAELIVAAQFHAYEKDTPKYVTEAQERYVLSPDADKGVAEEWAKIAQALDFPPAVGEGVEADEGAGGEAEGG
jgi:hypothetical protein